MVTSLFSKRKGKRLYYRRDATVIQSINTKVKNANLTMPLRQFFLPVFSMYMLHPIGKIGLL
ncbi:MAG TPA: hypothetical protein VFU79_08865 [Nitrososphaeraceae archaeon]|nr:hypothetical protein [Nitrososphaeraceae archaeon]